MLKEIWTGIEPALVNLLVTLATVALSTLSYKGVQALNSYKQLSVAKLGATNYNLAREVAKGLFKVLESEFSEVAKSGDLKRAEMENKLLELFPSLTKSQLDAINKEVWSIYNEELKSTGLLEEVQNK